MKIESNIKDILNGLSSFEKKQIPYIQMLTTNNIAFDYISSQKNEINKNLKINKRQIPSALRIKKATKIKPYAEIYVDEWSWQYKSLIQHFTGGDRHRKGLEKAMIAKGYMYKSEILTPSPSVTIRPSQYVKIMSKLKLNYKAGYSANETARSKRKKKDNTEYFIITGRSKSPLAPGVYMRMGRDAVCILRISEKPEYRKRFDMNRLAQDVYVSRGNRHFDSAYRTAMRGARW